MATKTGYTACAEFIMTHPSLAEAPRRGRFGFGLTLLLGWGEAAWAGPVADAGGPYTGVAGSEVTLDASASDVSLCSAVRYAWDCDNDGTIDETYSVDPAYVWQTDGLDGPLTQTVRLVLRCEVSLGSSSYYIDAEDSTEVTLDNAPPVILRIEAPETVDEGGTLTVSVAYQDPEATDSHTVAWSLSDGQSAEGVNATFDVGGDEAVDVQVTVTDDDGGLDTLSQRVTVENQPPSISGSPSTEISVHDVYVFAPVGSDPGGDGLSWGLSTVPEGATFDEATGAFAWTPGEAQAGDWPFRLSVEDGDGGQAYLEWTVHVRSGVDNPGAQPLDHADLGRDGALPLAPGTDQADAVVICGLGASPSGVGLAILALVALTRRRRLA